MSEQEINVELLSTKKVWNLSIDEIEYVFTHRHMNSYVYAALKTFHCSNPPVGESLLINKKTIPDYLLNSIQMLFQISQRFGHEDPEVIRIYITYYSYELMRCLKYLSFDDLKLVIKIISLLAFIPIIAEKNADFPLWKHCVIRDIHPDHFRLFDEIKNDIHIDTYSCLPFFGLNSFNNKSPLDSLFSFMPRAICGILCHIENNGDLDLHSSIFNNVEEAMICFEKKHNLGSDFSTPLNITHTGQIRYRNTLYLYGANHFERMNRQEKAYSWYLRDIDTFHLPDPYGFYLTDFKTCERLIRGFNVSPENKEKVLLMDLIDIMMFSSFKNCSRYAEKVLDLIEMNPGIDLSGIRLEIEGQRPMLYAGEAMREIYFLCLLYEYYIERIDFGSLDYSYIFRGPHNE